MAGVLAQLVERLVRKQIRFYSLIWTHLDTRSESGFLLQRGGTALVCCTPKF
jgi:hypothetical protein